MEGKRAAIFNVGLLVAGSFTLAAFTYTETTIAEAEKQAVAVEEDITFVVEDKEPEPKVKTEQPQSQNQQQSEQQNLGSQTALAVNIIKVKSGNDGLKKPDGPGGYGFDIPFEKPDISAEDKIVIPKIDAAYVGGVNAMKVQIGEVQEYPVIDRELGNQGTVYVSFVVEKDGSVTNVKTVRGVSETLDREAERIVKTFPKWIPGQDEWGAVRSRVRLPITFILH